MNHGLQNLFNEISFSTSNHPRDLTNERMLQLTIHFYFINNINNTKGKKIFYARNINFLPLYL